MERVGAHICNEVTGVIAQCCHNVRFVQSEVQESNDWEATHWKYTVLLHSYPKALQ